MKGGGGWPPGPWKGGQGKGAAQTREILRTLWWRQTGGTLIELFSMLCVSFFQLFNHCAKLIMFMYFIFVLMFESLRKVDFQFLYLQVWAISSSGKLNILSIWLSKKELSSQVWSIRQQHQKAVQVHQHPAFIQVDGPLMCIRS